MAQAVMIYMRPPWLLHVYMKKAEYMEMDRCTVGTLCIQRHERGLIHAKRYSDIVEALCHIVTTTKQILMSIVTTGDLIIMSI